MGGHGLVVLFGSGETSASGGRAFDRLFGRLPPPEVQALARQRLLARTRRDYAAADALRKQIAGFGWQVQDTPEGFRFVPLAKRSGPAGEGC